MPAHATHTILVIISYYLPGQRAGGPVRSTSNLVSWLGQDFQFKILTRDHDLGDPHPYPTLEYGIWHSVGNAQVRYLAPTEWRLWRFRRVIRSIAYDSIYLDSAFSITSLLTLMLYQLRLIPHRPLILAPRGQISPGALSLKATKKRFFLQVARIIGLYRGIFWHASSDLEKIDIEREFQPAQRNIEIISNLPIPVNTNSFEKPPDKMSGSVRLIYLSRIVRKKNLAFLLERLKHVIGQVNLDIYGPQEDVAYWDECAAIIVTLPPHITVTYCRDVAFDNVLNTFSHYHLFVLPTLSENFGHVIIESLAAGCPVLTSDQTPWHDLEEKNVGWAIPLNSPADYEAIIQTVIDMPSAEFKSMAKHAQDYGQNYLHNPTVIEATRHFFWRVISIRMRDSR